MTTPQYAGGAALHPRSRGHPLPPSDQGAGLAIAPGWYRDPAEPTTQRWWDGEGWLGEPLPADADPPPGPPPAGPPTADPGQASTGSHREPQVPAVPGMPGATEAPPPADHPAHPPPAGDGPSPDQQPSGWAYRPPAPATPPRPHGHTLATPGVRLLARLVDIGLVLAMNVVVNGWLAYQYWIAVSPIFAEAWRRSQAGESLADLPSPDERAANLPFVILIIATALWFAYEVPAVANSGQTPGKRLLRIRVVRLESAGELGFGRSFRRWNTMGVPTLLWYCFGIGLLLQLVDALFVPFSRPLHQALHDRSAHTVVVALPAPGGPGGTSRTPHEEDTDEPADPS